VKVRATRQDIGRASIKMTGDASRSSSSVYKKSSRSARPAAALIRAVTREDYSSWRKLR